MAPRLATLTPYASPWHFFGAELRWWRLHRGMSLAELARCTHSGPDLICKIEKADRAATRPIIAECDAALNTGGVLGRLLVYAQNVPAAPAASVAEAPVSPPSIVIHISTAFPVGGPPAQPVSVSRAGGGARVYPIAAARQRRRT